MRGWLAVSSAIALIALLQSSHAVAGAPPLVTEVSIDGDVDLNNRVRYGFQTVEGSERYNIQYSDVPFTNYLKASTTANRNLDHKPGYWFPLNLPMTLSPQRP